MRATVHTEGLNIHARPDGVITDQLKRGNRVLVTGAPSPGQKCIWWYVELIGDRISAGWVDGRALNFEGDAQIKMPPAPPPHNPNWPSDMQLPRGPDIIPEPLFPEWMPVAAAVGVIIVITILVIGIRHL